MESNSLLGIWLANILSHYVGCHFTCLIISLLWESSWVWCNLTYGLPRWLSGKIISLQCRRYKFDPRVRTMPWRRKWQVTLVFLPGKSNGRAWWATAHGVAKESETKQQQQSYSYDVSKKPLPRSISKSFSPVFSSRGLQTHIMLKSFIFLKLFCI